MKAKEVMSVDQLREVLERRKIIRQTFNEGYVQQVFETVATGTPYESNWHIGYQCELAMAVYTGELRRVVLNIAPRTTKSIVWSVGFTSWVLGDDPTYRILAGSGVQKLATRFSDENRKVLRSKWYRALFPKTELRPGQDEKTKFETTKGGMRLSISFGTSVVGEGGRLKLIDDPIDPDKAFSAAEIEATTRFYNNSWSTRTDNPEDEREVLVMQRVHRKDLSQHLVDIGYTHIVVPQEAPTKTIIIFPRSGKQVTREVGEFINPKRFGVEAKSQALLKLGTNGYAAQHQQKPVAAGGNVIKLSWFGRYKELPAKPKQTVISVDTASKKGEFSNPTAFIVFMQRHDDRWCLAHVLREKMIYPELKHAFTLLESRYKPNTILVEDKSSGTQLLQEARTELKINTCVAIEPDIDKVGRMERELVPIENGMLLLPDPVAIKTPWLYDLEAELGDFPQALTFDQIDSLSQFLRWLRTRNRQLETW